MMMLLIMMDQINGIYKISKEGRSVFIVKEIDKSVRTKMASWRSGSAYKRKKCTAI